MLIKRIYDQEDYEIALSIRKKVFIEEQNVDEILVIDEHESHTIHFLVYLDSEPIGTGGFRTLPPAQYAPKYLGILKFEHIAILKKFRNKNIGSALVQHMLQVAKKHFQNHLPMMDAVISAVPFYENLGWIAIGKTFLKKNIPLQQMIHPN